MAKYYLNLPKKNKHFVKTPKNYDVEKLNNNKLAWWSIWTHAELYEKFVTITNNVTEESVRFKRGKPVENMSAETAILCQERREIRKRLINSSTDIDHYMINTRANTGNIKQLWRGEKEKH